MSKAKDSRCTLLLLLNVRHTSKLIVGRKHKSYVDTDELSRRPLQRLKICH